MVKDYGKAFFVDWEFVDADAELEWNAGKIADGTHTVFFNAETSAALLLRSLETAIGFAAKTLYAAQDGVFLFEKKHANSRKEERKWHVINTPATCVKSGTAQSETKTASSISDLIGSMSAPRGTAS